MGAGLERCGWSCWCQQNIHLLERRIEVATNQGTDLLSLFVVGIHVTGGEGIGADQNPALHLGSETFGATAGGHARQAFGIVSPEAIFDAVVTGQIGGGFRRRDDVVRGDAVVEARAAHIHQFSAESLQLGSGSLYGGLHFGIKPFGVKTFADDADLQSLDGCVQAPGVIGNVRFQTSGIARIMAGDHLKQLGRIRHRPGERSDLIQGTGKGNKPPTADPAVGGLQPHNTAEGSRLADRAARIRTE